MTKRKRTDFLVVHVTATPPTADIGAREVDRMHKARGWSGIGYHYVIRRSGRVDYGRPESEIGAHVTGYNGRSIGVALVGGVDATGRPEDNRTPAQTAALEKLLRELAARYPSARICGHRDLSPDRDGDGIIEPHEHLKACPCFDAVPWAARRGLPAAAIAGVWEHGTIRPPAPDAGESRNAYLQKLLAMAGYSPGPLDGIAGPKTAAAVRKFQAAAGLKTTGKFDEATIARLEAMGQQSAASLFGLGEPEPLDATDFMIERALRDEGSRTIARADAIENGSIWSRAWAFVSGGGAISVMPYFSYLHVFAQVLIVLALIAAGIIFWLEWRKARAAREIRAARIDDARSGRNTGRLEEVRTILEARP